jgi:hypothetical protein
MNKEIKINPDLFKTKKTLKRKTLTGTEIKKALLQSMNSDPILTAINELELIQKPEPVLQIQDKVEYKQEKPQDPVQNIQEPDYMDGDVLVKTEIKADAPYGCLKQGIKPTFRQWKTTKNTPLVKTVKRYSSFGKSPNRFTVRVLMKNIDTQLKVEKEKKLLDTHSMETIRDYLLKRGLYKIGSSAPDDVLRKIYKDAYLTGDVENNNSDLLMHNYLQTNN